MLGEMHSAEGPLPAPPAARKLTDAHEHAPRPTCAWCSGRFTPRRTGGRPQCFCSEPCRRASEKSMREWARGELAAGRVTIAEIKRERSSEPAPAVPCPDAITPSDEPRALS